MAQTPSVDLNALWKWVTDQIKAETHLPNFWRALEAAVPITLENRDELVVGLPDNASDMAGQLTESRNRNMIEQALERGTRVRIRLRVIHGTTMDDWNHEKQVVVEAARLQAMSAAKYRQETSRGDTWENVGEQLIREYNAQKNRGLTCVQATFLEHAVDVLAESYRRLMPEKPGEMDERNYSRTLDRMVERVGVPAVVIGYLVNQRLKNP